MSPSRTTTAPSIVQVLALSAVEAPGITFQQDSTGTTVMEAENYFAATTAPDGHVWIPLSARAGYSGSGYMTVLPDANVNAGNTGFEGGARLDYRVNFTRAGTNYLWLRGGDPVGNSAGDSVHAGINQTPSEAGIRIDGAPTFNVATGWNWVGNIQGDTRAYIVVPSPGEHTVNFWMREDGFVLDKIILTTDAAFTPSGNGPAESQQTGGGPRPTISVSRNAAGAVVINYTGTLEASTTVDGTYTPVSGASGGTYTPNLQQTPRQFFRARN